MSTLCKLQPKTLMLRKTGKVYRQSYIFSRSVECTIFWSNVLPFRSLLRTLNRYRFISACCYRFSHNAVYINLNFMIQRKNISLANDLFGKIFLNLFSMHESLFTVNMAMRWEMRLKNSSHVKMMNHHEKTPKNTKISSILKSIFSNRTRCERLLKENAVYELFTTTFFSK